MKATHTTKSYYMLARIATSIIASLGLILGSASEAFAQEIIISPRFIEFEDPRDAADMQIQKLVLDDDGNMQLAAWVVIGNEMVDITDLCSWSVTTNGFVHWNSAQHALNVFGQSRAIVRVQYGDAVGTVCLQGAVVPSELFGPSPVYISNPEQESHPTPEQMNVAFKSILNDFSDAGLSVAAWQHSLTVTRVFHDLNGFKGWFGNQVSVVPGVPHDDGLFQPVGIAVFNPGGLGVNVEQDTVVFNAAYADQMLQRPADKPLMHDGSIQTYGNLVLEELLHAILHQTGVSADMSYKTEDDTVDDISEIVADRIVISLRILSEEELTDSDRKTLDTQVRMIKNAINDARRHRNTAARKYVDEILQAIGWTDADGDGLPDWFEQKLRDKGIDPDQPIWTPAPGGGGNPQPIDENPIPPGEGDPTYAPVPESVPVDPNG